MEKDKKEDNGSIAVARSQVRTHVQRRVKLNNTSIKKLKPKEIIADQILIGSSYVKGQMLTIKKTMKKTKPKFLFELIFILFINFQSQQISIISLIL